MAVERAINPFPDEKQHERRAEVNQAGDELIE
jgi:hypothetical protein